MAYRFEIKDQQQRQFVEQITQKAEEYFANAGIVSPVNKGIDIKVTVSSRMTRALGKTIMDYNPRAGILERCEIRISKEITDIGSMGLGSQTMAHELIHVLYPTQGHGPIFKAVCKQLNEHNEGIDISVQWSGQGVTPEEKAKMDQIQTEKQQKRMERKREQIKKLQAILLSDLMSPDMLEQMSHYNELRP